MSQLSRRGLFGGLASFLAIPALGSVALLKLCRRAKYYPSISQINAEHIRGFRDTNVLLARLNSQPSGIIRIRLPNDYRVTLKQGVTHLDA